MTKDNKTKQLEMEVAELQEKLNILETTIYESINVMVNTSTNFELKEHDLRACLGVCIGNLFYGLEQIKDEE